MRFAIALIIIALSPTVQAEVANPGAGPHDLNDAPAPPGRPGANLRATTTDTGPNQRANDRFEEWASKHLEGDPKSLRGQFSTIRSFDSDELSTKESEIQIDTLIDQLAVAPLKGNPKISVLQFYIGLDPSSPNSVGLIRAGASNLAVDMGLIEGCYLPNGDYERPEGNALASFQPNCSTPQQINPTGLEAEPTKLDAYYDKQNKLFEALVLAIEKKLSFGKPVDTTPAPVEENPINTDPSQDQNAQVAGQPEEDPSGGGGGGGGGQQQPQMPSPSGGGAQYQSKGGKTERPQPNQIPQFPVGQMPQGQPDQPLSQELVERLQYRPANREAYQKQMEQFSADITNRYTSLMQLAQQLYQNKAASFAPRPDSLSAVRTGPPSVASQLNSTTSLRGSGSTVGTSRTRSALETSIAAKPMAGSASSNVRAAKPSYLPVKKNLR